MQVFTTFFKKNPFFFADIKKCTTFALAKAQMAESVDALVSNTSGATHPGSIPGLGTETEKVEELSPFSFLPTRNPLAQRTARRTVHLQSLGGDRTLFPIIKIGLYYCQGMLFRGSYSLLLV